MRKYILCLTCLMMVFVWALPCQAASQVKWQIEWLEDGQLLEEVRIPADITQMPTDQAWERSQGDNEQVFRRDIPSWMSYQSHKDRLPFIIEEKKNILYSYTLIKADPQANKGWFQQLSHNNDLELTMQVPGLVLASTADRRDDLRATWNFSPGAALLNEAIMLKIVRIDGLVLGIGIVVIGLVIGGIIFYRRLKKAEQIIAEYYAIPPKNTDPNKNEPK